MLRKPISDQVLGGRENDRRFIGHLEPYETPKLRPPVKQRLADLLNNIARKTWVKKPAREMANAAFAFKARPDHSAFKRGIVGGDNVKIC